MAKVLGTIVHREGGFTGGWVGDLPVGEAIEVVQEGRLKLDYPPADPVSRDIAELLAGLEVESLAELAFLVRAGRCAEQIKALALDPAHSSRMLNRSEILKLIPSRTSAVEG